MKVDSLVICTVAVLKLLIMQFELGNISCSTFKDHTQLKIKLLEDNIGNIRSQEVKEAAVEILGICNKIALDSESRLADCSIM